MYAGLATTVISIVIPYIDRVTSNTLADHIRAGYPTYTAARIKSLDRCDAPMRAGSAKGNGVDQASRARWAASLYRSSTQALDGSSRTHSVREV